MTCAVPYASSRSTFRNVPSYAGDVASWAMRWGRPSLIFSESRVCTNRRGMARGYAGPLSRLTHISACCRKCHTIEV